MSQRVCPVWIGYLLASPIRKLLQNPRAILAPYVKGGMTVLDFGCAMGFFSIPLAHMVGAGGKVICVDMQEKMLRGLERRARKAGVSDRVEARLCDQHSLGLEEFAGKIAFALAFAVVHEVPDHPRLFGELAAVLVPEGRLLVAEPRGHVTEDDFSKTLSIAQQQGFAVVEKPQIRGSWAALQKKAK